MENMPLWKWVSVSLQKVQNKDCTLRYDNIAWTEAGDFFTFFTTTYGERIILCGTETMRQLELKDNAEREEKDNVLAVLRHGGAT